MKIGLSITCILIYTLTFSQKSKLTGFITEQNTGMKIEGVMVKSPGANPIESSSSGYFVLTFQDLPAGKNIIVRAEKDGWELVNEKEMNTFIPENSDEKPFKIIFCKAGLLAKAKSKYYETFELNLQKELDNQKALNKGNVKKIASLEEDYSRVRKQLYDLADEYSRIDLSTASAKDLEGIELFKAGKYDEFIQLKNTIVTEAQADKAIKNKNEAVITIANADSTVALYFKSQNDVAKTLILQFKFVQAEKVYEKIMSKDTNNFSTTFEYAKFLQLQNYQDKSLTYYQKALKLAKAEDEIARTQNNLGTLYQDKNYFPAALDAYQKALEINKKLAKINPALYEVEVANNEMNLGRWYQDNNDYSAALNAYLKALEIHERLAKNNSNINEYYLALTQNNLGCLYRDVNNFAAALDIYRKALKITEKLTRNDSSTYEPFLATIHHNLGMVYSGKNDYPAALKSYGKAFEIRERLAKVNPNSYEPLLAMTQNNLANLYSKTRNFSAARNNYNKTVELLERLVKNSPETYEPFVATIQYNLGNLNLDNKYYPAALSAYQKALEIRERLAVQNPHIYDPNVAETVFNLGNLYRYKGDFDTALKFYQKASTIFKRFAKVDSNKYEVSLAMTQYNLGLMFKAKKEYTESLNAYTEALEIYERLAIKDPSIYEPSLAATQNNLGSLYEAKNDYTSALNAYRKALEIRERLAKTTPSTYEPSVAMTQKNLGRVYKAKKDQAAALNAYQKALEISILLSRISPATYESDVAAIQEELGILYQEKKEYSAAFNAYQKALEIFERFAKKNPTLYEIELSRCIILLVVLQKEDYQENRQNMIEQQINIAKQILLKYIEDPVAKNQFVYLKSLEVLFSNKKNILAIQTLQREIKKCKDFMLKIDIQKKIVEKYRLYIDSGQTAFAYDLGANLGDLAWYYIFEKKFSAAENASREALNPTKYRKTEDYDVKLEWVNTILALALLFQDKYMEAEKIYISMKDKLYNNSTYTKTFLADFEELENAGITHPDIAKIRALLKKNK